MRSARAAGAAVLAFAAALPAAAKTDEAAPKADGSHLKWARSYAEALAEGRERGCAVFATFHEDG
jgi:hypothetical protein